jgi:hypothetical protein
MHQPVRFQNIGRRWRPFECEVWRRSGAGLGEAESRCGNGTEVASKHLTLWQAWSLSQNTARYAIVNVDGLRADRVGLSDVRFFQEMQDYTAGKVRDVSFGGMSSEGRNVGVEKIVDGLQAKEIMLGREKSIHNDRKLIVYSLVQY